MAIRARYALSIALLALISGPTVLAGQANKAAPSAERAPARSPAERARLLAAAREIMTAQQYCAFITVDRSGRAQVRTVNPFPPDDEFVVWFATGKQTRKVQEIRDNPHVVVYYADHAKATGYVALAGTAVLVTDQAEIDRHRRAYWAQSFPGDRNLVLVKVIPERVDVLNYQAGTRPDSVTWRTPFVDFEAPAKK